jgi:hypothetical protein
MANTEKVNRIINYIGILDYNEKLEVLERLVRLIKRPNQEKLEKKRSLTDLKGLGKEVWKGIDASDYVYHERSSWN